MTKLKIKDLLKHTDHAALKDQLIFRNWERRNLTTEQTIEEFRKNNDIVDRVEITNEEFIAFVNSLGYRRGREKCTDV